MEPHSTPEKLDQNEDDMTRLCDVPLPADELLTDMKITVHAISYRLDSLGGRIYSS